MDATSGATVATIPVASARRAADGRLERPSTATRRLARPTPATGCSVSDPGSAGAALAAQTKPFALRRHSFPVPGTHSYGGAGSRFGAGRAGHTHQGQDMGAACGEKLYAAEAGDASRPRPTRPAAPATTS